MLAKNLIYNTLTYKNMKQIYVAMMLALMASGASGQTVYWVESFDVGYTHPNHYTGGWVLSNPAYVGGTYNMGHPSNPTPGSTVGPPSSPTTVGSPITGLTYNAPAEGVGNKRCNNYWVINDANTANASMQAVRYGTPPASPCTPDITPNTYFPYGGTQNRSLHITAGTCNCLDTYPGSFEFVHGQVPGYGDAYQWNDDPWDPLVDNFNCLATSDQWAYMNSGIDNTGKCKSRIRFDAFLGGANNGWTQRSVLYSIDGGVTWKVLVANITSPFSPFFNPCGFWQTYTYNLPAECDNVADLRFAFRWRNFNGWPQTTADGSNAAGMNIDNIRLISPQLPDAVFTVNPVSACRGQQFSFTNSSVDFGITPVTYTWVIPTTDMTLHNAAAFDAVNVVGPNTHCITTSKTVTPQISYSTIGSRIITLNAVNCNGDADPTPMSVTINVALCGPVPDFTGTPLTVCDFDAPISNPSSPVVVQLNATDENTIIPCTGGCVKWTWIFTGPGAVTYEVGDPNSQNPQVKFNTPGLYTVTLVVRNNDDLVGVTKTRTNYINVINCECGVTTPPPPAACVDFNTTGNTSINTDEWPGGYVTYNNFTINAGHTVSIIGSNPFRLDVQGNVIINGTLLAAGEDAAGPTGATGYAGGQTGGNSPGTPTAGTGGAGLGGGTGGTVCTLMLGVNGNGGGGGGYGDNGGSGAVSSNGSGVPCAAQPPGGGAYGNAPITTLHPGSGGGGGGGCSGGPGGGGGAGGGAVRILANNITIGATGMINVSGGKGGPGPGDITGAGAGGGGAGGSIQLIANTVVNNGTLRARGGNGGDGVGTLGSGYGGGGGAGGRINIKYVTSATAGTMQVNGGNGGAGAGLCTPCTATNGNNGTTLVESIASLPAKAVCIAPPGSGGGCGGPNPACDCESENTDGALNVTSGTTTINTTLDADGVYHYTSVNIAAGATLRVIGNKPYVMKSTGPVIINGLIDLRGTNGANGPAAGTCSGATGGTPGAGGGAGGAGAPCCSASNGCGCSANAGGAGDVAGAGGIGSRNGKPGSPCGNCSPGGGGGGANGGGGGTGGTGTGSGTSPGGAGGTTLLPNDVSEAGGIRGGSGGAGGVSGACQFSSGAGGGGGGAIKIVAPSVTIGTAGQINANGGNGGNIASITGLSSGGGGGGAGGTIWIQSPNITNNNASGLTARGGNGGNSGSYSFFWFTYMGGRGGGGGGGRIYIQGNYTGPVLSAGTVCAGGATGASGGNAGTAGSVGTLRIDGVCTLSSSTKQWVGGGTPDVNAWNQNNNWNPPGVPTTGADVVIPDVPHQPIITTVTPVLGSLTVNNKALVRIHTGGVLNVNGIINGGAIRMDGGFVNAVNVCNNELIEVNNPSNYMTVTGYLKNNGYIQTNNLDPGPDVRMMDSDPASANNSRYEGTGTNIGVDYYIINTPAVNIQTVLEANLSCRSLIVQGNLVASDRTVTLKKDYNVQSGTVTYTNSTFVLDGDGTNTVTHGGNPQTLSAAAIQTFHNLFVQKPNGHALLNNTFRVSNTLRFACQNAAYVDANGHVLHLTNNASGSLERIPSFADPLAGHVVGKFRRGLTSTGVFEFPLGINNSVAATSRYERAQMDVKAVMPGFMSNVTGEFLAVGHPTASILFNESSALPISGTDNPIPYQEFIPGPGYWNLTPNNDPTSIDYELSIWPNGFAGPASPYWTFSKRRTTAPTYPWGLRGTKTATSWPWVKRTGVTTFSDAAPVQSLDPLPVEATPLMAQALSNEIRLTWQTLSERSNKGFEIERGTDGENFAKIGFVEGAGTTIETKNYSFDDRDVQRGTVYYYRYKQLDFDGRHTYSNVAQAILPTLKDDRALGALTVYPNPFKNTVTFNYALNKPARLTLEIYDLNGKLVTTPFKNLEAKTSGEKSVDLSSLSPGVYVYRLKAGAEAFTGKLVRE